MTENSQKIQKAIDFATEKHKDMVRKGTGINGVPAVPYILHPLEAMGIVASITNDEDAICAMFLDSFFQKFGVRHKYVIADELHFRAQSFR